MNLVVRLMRCKGLFIHFRSLVLILYLLFGLCAYFGTMIFCTYFGFVEFLAFVRILDMMDNLYGLYRKLLSLCLYY